MASQTQVIIIGTGWAGLAAAKTYLQISPSISLTLLTSESSVGGVWSQDRLYPNLIANSPNGLYEFSDLSMVDAANAAYELIPGERVQDYLHKYAEKFDLMSQIKFRTKVTRAVRRKDVPGWTLTLLSGEILDCDKLIVSSGLHSKPKWPTVPQNPSFKGTVIHSRSLGSQYSTILASKPRDIVVVGGCKSAVEACTLFLESSTNTTIHWLIRPSSQGVPMVVMDPKMKPNFVAAAQTRLFSVFGPTVFNTTGFWYRFLHSGRNWIGSKLFDGFWGLMSRVVKAGPNYGKSANGRLIEPNGHFFWLGAYISLLYKDSPFLKWLHDSERMKVYRETPSRLADGHMELANGEKIKADAVIYCTGWESSLDFFSPQDAAELGIPVSRNEDESDPHRDDLMVSADASVRSDLPFLSTAAPHSSAHPYTQFRMYRQILSPSLLAQGDRTIAFSGFVSTGQTALANELLSLWAVAWLEGILPTKLPSEEDMEWEVARVNACMSRRYGMKGAKDPEIILEVQWFFDELMRDFGLRAQRKKGALREWIMPYTSADYKGVVDEFLEKFGRRKVD